jgi:asparagine synthase (glutamine-hydrolysing)
MPVSLANSVVTDSVAASTFLGDFLLLLSADPRARPGEEWHARINLPVQIGTGPGQFRQVGPGVSLWWRGGTRLASVGAAGGAGLSHLPDSPVTPQGGSSVDPVLQRWTQRREVAPEQAAGRYGYALWDAEQRRVVALTDAFRTYPLYYTVTDELVACATDLRLILAARIVAPKADLHSLYHYLNFSYVPAPHTILENVHKVPPGHVLRASPGRAATAPYWDARYAEDLRADTDTLAHELRERIVQTVIRYQPSCDSWGTFLSGGTDSSSISGILARNAKPGRVKSFSIGFGESGYDELAYARIAATHFDLDARERNVSEQDAVAAIPRLIQAFDEPFGNASAIPSYYCAALAQESGVDVLVAGDGGDEIFGGNERYRKDRIFDWYHHSPRLLQRAVQATLGLVGGADVRIVNRVRNFVHRGSLPNPDRFYTDDSFASDQYAELLGASFRAVVDPAESLELLRRVYGQAAADCGLHKLMYLDLKMAIAENDVVKVTRAARLAGVSVVFPYLDQDLVQFTGRLPCDCKLRGLEKRYLFKRAVRDILPREIIKKKKHGFGLPISVWLRRPGPYRDLVYDIVLSSKAASRGYFEPRHVRALFECHARGAWDYSSETYLLLMLELWHRTYLDGEGNG